MPRWIVPVIAALAVLTAVDAMAFSGFKGRFQGRCQASDGVSDICGVGVTLPEARNGTRLEGGGYTFVCRGNEWQVLGGGRSCCGAVDVDVCGAEHPLPVGERGEEVWVRTGASREVMYRCNGNDWRRVEEEVWGLCKDLLGDMPGRSSKSDDQENNGPKVLEWR